MAVANEASGIAGYRTERRAEALAELRAARRMTGRDDYLPLLVWPVGALMSAMTLLNGRRADDGARPKWRPISEGASRVSRGRGHDRRDPFASGRRRRRLPRRYPPFIRQAVRS